MKSEETKQQVKSIFEMVITGEQENIELAGTLIESLNLFSEFKKYAKKKLQELRIKTSFNPSEKQQNTIISYIVSGFIFEYSFLEETEF